MALTWPQMDEGEWNLVAESVMSGNITRFKSQYKYNVTEVKAGATAPLDSLKNISPVLFEDGNVEEINSPILIDIYIWIEDANSESDKINIENAIRINS